MNRPVKLIVVTALILSLGLAVLGISHRQVTAASTSPSPTSLTASQTPGDIVVPTTRNQSTAQALTNRAKSSWPWYITRAAGLTAAVLLVILILSGIGQVTGYTFKFLEPITAWATHRALGIALACAVVVHVGSLWFDRFVPFGLADILVPFWSSYKPVVIFGVHLGSLYVALGSLAFYGLAAVVASSLLWVEKKPYTWKLIHFTAYMIIAFIFVHALFLGTDLAHGLFRWLWIIFGISIAGAVLHRLRRARTI